MREPISKRLDDIIARARATVQSSAPVSASKFIRQNAAGEYCVIGEESGRNFGCFETREEAEERLRQIERFGDEDKAQKFLPSGAPEVGIHLHALERENGKTKVDGAHLHLFGFFQSMKRDVLDRDHACAFCGASADHATIVHGGKAFVPTCKAHVRNARSEARKAESAVVAIRRLVKPEPFKLRKGVPTGRLPALKVRDPREMIRRLTDGEPAGLLSVRNRTTRVGKQQALVNEIAGGFSTAHVWGVVRQKEPIEVASLDELEPALRQSIVEDVVKEFAGEPRIFYLPLELEVVFEAPIALGRPPGGRRFARHVDFGSDLAKRDERQLDMDALFTQAVDKSATDFISAPEQGKLRELSDTQLDALDAELHSVFGRAEEKGISRDQIVRACAVVMREYERRGKAYRRDDELTRAARERLSSRRDQDEEKTVKRDAIVSRLSEVLRGRALPAVYLVGKGTHDAPFEIVVTGPVDLELFDVVKFHVRRALPKRVVKSVKFRRAPTGVHQPHVKLFELHLTPTTERATVEPKPIDDDGLMELVKTAQGRLDARMQYRFERGTLHGDLRIAIGDDVLSWRMALGKDGARATDVETAREIAKTFDVLGSDFNRPLVAPSRVYAIPRVEKGGSLEEVVDGDLVIDAARPSVELGVCTADTVELFVSQDPRFAGRLVFKRLGDDQRFGPEGGNQWRGRFEELVPAVLEKDGPTVAPGAPLLPASLAAVVPPDLRFWETDSGTEAARVRDALADARWIHGGNVALDEHGEFRRVTEKVYDLTTTEPLDEDDVIFAEVLRLEQAEKRSRSVRLINRSAQIQKDALGQEERFVFGVVLVPNEVDAQGDIYDEATVRDAAHSFLEFFGGGMKIMHSGEAVDGLVVLESYVSKVEEEHGGETFPVGTWFLAVRVKDDDLWQAVKRGDFTGFSIGGTAVREPLSPDG